MRPRLGVWCGQLRIERYEHAEDSGGLGRYRGGIGIQAADYRNLSGAPMPVQTEIELSNPAFPSVGVRTADSRGRSARRICWLAMRLRPFHRKASIGFVRVTASRQRVAHHAYPQATFKLRGRAIRPMRRSVSACRLGGWRDGAPD